MRKLISALEKTIEFLEVSEDSDWSAQSANDAKNILKEELKSLKEKRRFTFAGKSKIKFLFLPTGTLQEISGSNGWSDEYLQLSKIVDSYTK